MAYSVEFSRRAERDLGQIFAAIHAADSQAAARWFDGLQAHIEKLATLPTAEPSPATIQTSASSTTATSPTSIASSTASTIAQTAC